MSNRTLFFILAFLAVIMLAGCVDPRQRQREVCAEQNGKYIQMNEFDDDICLLPSGTAFGFDD